MQAGGLSIERTEFKGHLQLNLRGELDLAAAEDLRDELLRVEDDVPDQAEGVVVDTTELTFIDSSGLSVLVAARDRLGDQLTLVPGRTTRRLLTLSGTDEFFDV